MSAPLASVGPSGKGISPFQIGNMDGPFGTPARSFGGCSWLEVECRSVSRRRPPIALLLGTLACVGSRQRGQGRWCVPDELHVFVPQDQPSDVILAANFGLIESTDSGKTWVYVCEAQAGASGNVNLYQLGPTDTLLGDSFSGLFRSTSLGCTWGPAGGTLTGKYVYDAAFNPNSPGSVLALGNPPDGGSGSAIFASTDDAVTFGPPTYQTAASLSGIELSVSSPGLVYLTGNEPEIDGGASYFGNAFVMVGVDGGAGWGAPQDHPELNAELAGDAGADAGPPSPPLIRLAQVDPVDSQTVYLTLTLANSNESYLAVTHNGGKTIQLLFLAPETITAFLRSSNGTLYAEPGIPVAKGACSPRHPMAGRSRSSTRLARMGARRAAATSTCAAWPNATT